MSAPFDDDWIDVKKTLPTIATVALVAALIPMSGGTASAAEPGDPLAAVTAADPLAIADAVKEVPPSTISSAVISTEVAGVTVTIPRDPAAGIQLSDGKSKLTIGLPSAESAANAVSLSPGVVSYDSKNGATVVPIVGKNGTMQIDTVISSASAPSRYSYRLSVPKGQSLALAPDGSAYVAGGGKVSAFFPEPWAKDAAGRDVPTHFEVKGNTLTQIVDLSATEAFPVVADPQFAWHLLLPSVKMNRSETKQLTGIGAGPAGVGVAAKACGGYVKVAGAVGGALCALNIVSIMFNASKAWYDGKCAQLLIGPGVIGTIPYKDGYCK